MTAPQLQAKFLRAYAIPPNSGGTNGDMGWILRLVYEFWGFCVNGDNNLGRPGPGSVANSQLSGSYINMPVGWESGSNVLLASGSDGTTVQGLPYFNVTGSTPFSPNMVGKWLTMWQSGSTSTDDSIYYITQWLNSSSIVVDPSYGGTPVGPTGSIPQLTTRTGINYRVIDYGQVALMSYGTSNFLVIQFPRAAQVNAGQVQPQAKLGCGSFFTQFTITLSPSGSWNGAAFAGENYAAIYPETGLFGPGGGGWGTPDWFHNSGGGRGWVTLIGGLGFLICQAGSDSNGMMPNGGSCFQIEIPQRLYPQASDPNPICAMNFGNLGVGLNSQNGYGFAHRFFPSPYDSLTRRWPILTRNPMGSYWNGSLWNGYGIQGGNVDRWSFFFNRPLKKFWSSDGILCNATVNGQASVSGQFSLARARVRTMRFTSGGYPYYTRVGDNSDKWIHCGGGVLWP